MCLSAYCMHAYSYFSKQSHIFHDVGIGIARRWTISNNPARLSFEGDGAQAWKEWKQMLELYLLAKETTEKLDATKFAMLPTSLGPEGVKRYNHFSLDAIAGEDKSKWNSVMAKCDSVLSGENKVVFNWYKSWDYQRPKTKLSMVISQT